MINTLLEHVPLPIKLEVLEALELQNDSEETETDLLDDETTLMISSDEEAELEAQRIRFHELVGRNLQLRERGRSTSSSGSSVILLENRNNVAGASATASAATATSKTVAQTSAKRRCKKRTYSTCSVASSIATPASEMESCGNIFVHQAQAVLIFNCSFCDLRYADMTEFAKHLHEAHKLFTESEQQQQQQPQGQKLTTPEQPGKQPVRKSARNMAKAAELQVKTEAVDLPTALLDSQEPLESCGNIFVLNRQKLFLICGYCECKYATLELFSKHLRQQHQLLEGPVREIEVEPKQEIKTEVFAVSEAPLNKEDSSTPQPMVAIPEGMHLDNNDLIPTLSLDSQSNSSGARTPLRVSTETPPPEENEAKLSATKAKRKRAEPVATRKTSRKSRKSSPSPPVQPAVGAMRLRRASNQKPLKDFMVQPPSSPESAATDRLASEQDSASLADTESLAGPSLPSLTRTKKTATIFRCDQCPKTFQKSTRLIEHKRMHTGEKPFKCEECGKHFRIKMRLTEHALRHRKDKAFKCEICGLAVATRQDLTLHQRHHNGDKRYQCPQCPKAFVRSSDLKIHIRVHTGEKPFACEVCQKAFRANQNLIVHRRTHVGEKAYKCDYCDKRFMRNIDRKVHHRTHTGEKPYKCEICNRGYSSRVHVRSHIERDHVAAANGCAPQRKKPGPKPKRVKEEMEKQQQKQATKEVQLNATEQTSDSANEKSPSQDREQQKSPVSVQASPESVQNNGQEGPQSRQEQQKLEQLTPEETMQQVSLALKIALEDDDDDDAVDDEEAASTLEKENDTPKLELVVSATATAVAANVEAPLKGGKQASQQQQHLNGSAKRDRKITSYFTVVGQKTEF